MKKDGVNMGRKRRGRERLVSCVSCGRLVPRDKAVEYVRKTVYSTDMKGKEEDISAFYSTTVYYCISCAKHRKIFEKKKKELQKKRDRF